ncbi:hypothetical protein D3C81_702620 [compost metagenome]
MVGVEYGDELAIGDFECLVEVAGLGMLIVVAGDVVDPDLLTENLEFFPASVVEHVHPQFALGPVDGLGGKHYQFDDAQRFVIGGNEDIYRRPFSGRLLQKLRCAVQRPGGLYVTEDEDEQGIQFGQHQPVAKYGILPVVEAQGVGQAPVHVAQRSDQREGDQGQDRQTPGLLADDQAGGKTDGGKRSLGIQVQRRSEDAQHQQCCAQPGRDLQALAATQGPSTDASQESIHQPLQPPRLCR